MKKVKELKKLKVLKKLKKFKKLKKILQVVNLSICQLVKVKQKISQKENVKKSSSSPLSFFRLWSRIMLIFFRMLFYLRSSAKTRYKLKLSL